MSHGPVPAAAAGDVPPVTTAPPASATAAPHRIIACLVSRSRDRTVMENFLSLVRWTSDCGDGPLVVGAVVRCPHDGGRAVRGAAGAVQRCAGAAVDDLDAAVARAVQSPLLVVAAVP